MVGLSDPHGPRRAGDIRSQEGGNPPDWNGHERRQGPTDRRSGEERRDSERVEQDHHPRRNPSRQDRRQG